MNKLKKITLLSLLILLLSSCLTDLRTEFVIQNKSIENEIKGRQILENVFEQSNLKLLNEVNNYVIDFSDIFLNLKGAIANPYKQKLTKFYLNYTPNIFKGEMTILVGKEKGAFFSYNKGKTQELKDSVLVSKKNKRSQFWIPTYQYFIEFPMRILNADKIMYAGEKQYNNKVYDLVLVSWKTLAPQKKTDQYLVWVSKKTGKIDMIQYTIRDYYGFIQGVTYMSEYKNFNGLILPSVMKVKSQMTDKKLMHIMKIEDVKINYAIN